MEDIKKVRLSDIQKNEKYKTIIPFVNDDGIEDYIYVLNPKLDDLSKLVEYQYSLLEGDPTMTEGDLLKYLFDKFTNIEVDVDILDETENISLIQVYGELIDIQNLSRKIAFKELNAIYDKMEIEELAKAYIEKIKKHND